MKRLFLFIVMLICLVSATFTMITPSAHAAPISKEKASGTIFIGTSDSAGHIHYINPKYDPNNIIKVHLKALPFANTPCCIYHATCGASSGFAQIVSYVAAQTQCFARAGFLSDFWVSNASGWTPGNNSPAYIDYSPDGLNWYQDYIAGDYQWHNLNHADVDFICLDAGFNC